MKKIIVPIVLIIVLLVSGVIGYIHNDRYLNNDDSNETAVAVYVDEDVLELMEEIYGIAFDLDPAYSRDGENFYDVTDVIL